ncbi:flagellar biosynthetic protein FliO [Paenibacillus sp. NEAU-GSW1]|uniref:flagellar biosynthetic protein FliO n=1 Tax=Paenibacillus sp. NEAU-GSW1 TaxID=2682486 RepID=UPI0012E20F8E|nr:flagellar biosynthetic protein FliO [Paenibacillus sp. NEAU-GSW1]MUT66365.1 flagellar biogenesis protein [Paenibacillus sp. NEAU-GSW1]
MLNKISTISMLSVSGLAVWPSLAAASDLNGDSSKPPFSDSGNMTGSMIWVIISLFLVIGLIVIVLKWMSQRNRAWGTSRSLRSLGGIALGQNKSLQVIELEGCVYIVGVGENITLLDKVDNTEQAHSIIAAMERQATGGWSAGSITEVVKRFRKQQSGSESVTGSKADSTNEMWNGASSSFQSMLNDKLSRQADRKQQLEALLKDDKINERLMDDNEK